MPDLLTATPAFFESFVRTELKMMVVMARPKELPS